MAVRIPTSADLPNYDPRPATRLPQDRDVPSFLQEADALARILALAFDPARDLQTPAEPDVARLLVEALEHAYLAGKEAR